MATNTSRGATGLSRHRIALPPAFRHAAVCRQAILRSVKTAAAAAEPFVPERKFLDGEPDHVWRNGKPDYTVVNKSYLTGKTKNWAADSLESLVESVVKTLEMEISHKVYTYMTKDAMVACADDSVALTRTRIVLKTRFKPSLERQI
jgi:hypothetical protein